MGSSHKRAARRYQLEHPGTTFPEAKRAVARRTAGSTPPLIPDQVPWIRGLDDDHEPARCFFCGHAALKLSGGDLPVDPRRVQVYCDNDQCDAREIEVIVMTDATGSTRSRTDVQIMQRIAAIAERPAETLFETVGDWIPGQAPAARDMPGVCLFCGQLSCRRVAGDVAGDTGRLRLGCTHDACSIGDVEILVVRDGTPWTQSRADVRALDAIVPRGGGEQVGDIRVYRPRELRPTDEEVLEHRVSGPLSPGV
jgi:hypothetical protein